MAAGQLVPDSIVFQLLQERIALEDCRTNGFLLDGFPRNLKQALMLHDANIEIHGIVHLDVSTPVRNHAIVMCCAVTTTHSLLRGRFAVCCDRF